MVQRFHAHFLYDCSDPYSGSITNKRLVWDKNREGNFFFGGSHAMPTEGISSHANDGHLRCEALLDRKFAMGLHVDRGY